jgi:hypothetical protein
VKRRLQSGIENKGEREESPSAKKRVRGKVDADCLDWPASESFGVAHWNFARKVRQQISSGQRPGCVIGARITALNGHDVDGFPRALPWADLLLHLWC